ncbi:MAG: DNA methyltransferase [Candidatus Aenigmatarchaeota archaeon]
MRIIEAPEFKKLVTFIPNKKEPIHNWFYYKEGFSKLLVDYFIDAFNIKKDNIVFDPFCGVGTTLVTCKQRGINSVGIDVSPLACFVSNVKTRNYDIKLLENTVKEALKWKFEKPKELPKNKWIEKAFSKYAIEDIVFYKTKINEIEDNDIKNFLYLALIDSAMKCSYVYKDGAIAKIFKRPVPPVGKIFKYKIRKMLKDIKMQKEDWYKSKAEVYLGDARNIEFSDCSFDFVITSPPYLNKIEYTSIYKTEFSLFFDFPETKLRSYIGEKTDKDIAEAYFEDMNKVLNELYRVCKENAYLIIVIGGGCFPDKVVLVDEILAENAKQIGFKPEKIFIARKSWCTRARTIKVGQIRESILILKK